MSNLTKFKQSCDRISQNYICISSAAQIKHMTIREVFLIACILVYHRQANTYAFRERIAAKYMQKLKCMILLTSV